MVVPAVLVARMTVQYRAGIYRFAINCPVTAIKKIPTSSSELIAYPTFNVIDNKSPAVSPRVVAQIFVIQNKSVSCGIFDLIRYFVMINDLDHNKSYCCINVWFSAAAGSINLPSDLLTLNILQRGDLSVLEKKKKEKKRKRNRFFDNVAWGDI